MEESRIRLLLIEDDRIDRMAFQRFVRNEELPYEYDCAGSVAEAKVRLGSDSYDVVVMDFVLGDGTAFDLFDHVPGHVPIVVVTGGGDEETAVQAMKAGASDYVIKDPDGNYLKILPVTVSNAIKAKNAEIALQKARDELEKRVEERTAELKRVNDRLRLEVAERRKAEEKYRGIFENAVEGLFQTTPDGGFVNANPAAAQILGYRSPEELMAEVTDVRRQVYVCPGSREEFVARMREHQSVPTLETQMFRRDGTKIWVSIHARPVYGDDGELILIEGILEDITGRKEAEEAIWRSEQKYRSLVDNAPIGILSIDSTGRILDVNQKLLEILGPPSAQAAKALNVFTFPALKAAGISDLVKTCLEEKRVVTEELPYLSPGGKQSHVRIIAAPILLLHDATYGCQAAVEDITERKKAEAALLESRKRYRQLYDEAKRAEQLYRSLLDSTPDAVVVHDIEGRVLYLNDSFAHLFGWTRQEVKGSRIPNIPDLERQKTAQAIQGVLAGGEPCRGLHTQRTTKDGRVLDISISASRYLDHEGKPAGLIVVMSDITEQKRLQEQLRQASKMEAIGQLAGGVAHDFNNLLTAMMGYSNLLLHKIPKDADYREQVYQIGRAAERAASLTRQLLAFGRKQNLELKVIDVNSAITEFAKILGRLIGENIELVMRLDESLAPVEADPSQIEQILMNLAVNARDAMPGVGCLTLETANAVLDEEYARGRPEVTAGRYARIAISDNGCGMDSATVSRIFDPFFTTKEKGVGTGLGLSTVYGIVKQHHGHLAVYSEPGTGTTFKVYLPAVDQTPDVVSETTPIRASERYGAETVLLVEDEEIVRSLASEVLEMLGYRVLAASNPDEALTVSRGYVGHIDLLLTDVILPRMDGKTLYTHLSPERPEMAVLYVSGYTEGFIVQHGVLLPGVHFLQKPFTVTSLSAKVREVLDQPRRTFN
ncbi:MAG: PAS domain S-box protein [Pseudomonadota bacterium]